jgi:hypothetical protein
MGFRENLLAKIEIDRLTQAVRSSLGPAGSETRLDREAMRRLLAMTAFAPRRERDLELFVAEEGPDGVGTVLVLDNELPLYRTTAADVALRKSPTVGEMASIRNIIKILRDSDVKRSRREASLEAVRAAALARLDLSFTPEDIDQIRRDGIASFESRYGEGVEENLMLLAELLGYRPPPAALHVPHVLVTGAAARGDAGEELFGPAVFYARIGNELRWSGERFAVQQTGPAERFKRIASGREPADDSGPAVFERLARAVLAARPAAR